MSLIARHLEAEGIPTLVMASALDITKATMPPRTAYLDFPLGHTSGRPHSPQLNQEIVRGALRAFEQLSEPGGTAHLPFRWAHSDAWKDHEYVPTTTDDSGNAAYVDDRIERHDTPQYQTEEDAAVAQATHEGEDCLVCAGVDY